MMLLPAAPLAPAAVDPQTMVSAASPFTVGCDRENIGGTLFINAEVEPFLAIHPTDPQRRVGVWQQDRWSNGSSRGVMSATSFNGGQTWTRRPIPFSRCGGGTTANGGDFGRVSNPWVAYAANGIVHAVGLASSGVIFQNGSDNAIVASRSLDDGLTWSNPIALIRDGKGFFNDKDAIIADPENPALVYAVWDRLVAGDNGGPTYFARSSNSGASWEPAKPIYDPGPRSQTISNVTVVTRSGALVVMFVQIDYDLGNRARVAVVRSFDKGTTWTTPVFIADLRSVGTLDPNTAQPVRDQSIIPTVSTAPNGAIYVVWQDSRFDGGARDAIVISRSLDDGSNWTPPARVSTAANVAAFDPAVHVRADGTVGVTYYDFRSDGVAATLLTDAWLARSSDGGRSWTESRLADPFDLALAPRTTAGYFLGDYQGLASSGAVFVPFFAKANNANTSNRTDVFHVAAVSAIDTPIGQVRTDCGPPSRRPLATTQAATTHVAAIQARIAGNMLRARQQRLPLPASESTRDPRRRPDPRQ
ncbi:MAG: sialidase family protein [Pseudoxanthomonas sp.]